MTDLKNKTVLITGASAGIGKATAVKFAEAGARIIICGRRKERLEALANNLNCESYILEFDIQKRTEVESAIASLSDNWKEIDILVNNAGMARGLDKFHEGNIDGWEEMIDTNIKGLLYMSRTVIPGMVERRRGHIINIGSIAGHEVYPGGNIYCATKHAVNALTKGMRMDLLETPLRVSTVDPGLVETEFSDVRFYGNKEKAKKTYMGYTPLKPADVADTIVWIADRPEHVQIAEVIIFPSAQASAMLTHKET